MSSTMRVIARPIAIGVAAVFAMTATATAATTIDELTELNLRAWAGETELLSEVYAPDGVHTATFYDRTNEYVGPDEIGRVAGLAGFGEIELIGPVVEIPAADGELRWASFSSFGGGSACLLHAVGGQIVRHDCILPETSAQSRAWVGLADAETSAAIDEVQARLDGSWGTHATVESLSDVYAPDAVHSARYLNRTWSYDGLEEIHRFASLGSGRITHLGERVDFEAPEGELAWVEVVGIAGGSVCLFGAVDGMITRHDCVLPIRG